MCVFNEFKFVIHLPVQTPLRREEGAGHATILVKDTFCCDVCTSLQAWGMVTKKQEMEEGNSTVDTVLPLHHMTLLSMQ